MLDTPSPAGRAVLNDVACPGAASCFAVGSTAKTAVKALEGGTALIEHWNGHGAWHVMNGVFSPTSTTLTGVSCPIPTTCVALGSSLDEATSRSLRTGAATAAGRRCRAPS